PSWNSTRKKKMTSITEQVLKLRAVVDELALKAAELEVSRPEAASNRKVLTRRDVQRIRALHQGGWRNEDLAEAFDVNKSTITRILNGTYWRELGMGRVLVFDIDTHSADLIYTMPPEKFVRLIGYKVDNQDVQVTTSLEEIRQEIRSARWVVGHNV